jgi:hypothetical protein
MRTFLRLFIVLIIVAVPAVSTLADCQRWECRRYPDTATCYLRFGPNAGAFPLATSCDSYCDIMPDASGTGTLNYDCYCTYNYCYEV